MVAVLFASWQGRILPWVHHGVGSKELEAETLFAILVKNRIYAGWGN
jgi:hypothetical protein